MPAPLFPDRFEVLDTVSHGEGELLVRARDLMLGREVVLRRPAPDLASIWKDKCVIDAALRSARAMARVQHTGVERLLEVIATEDGPILVLEPVPGETLAQRVARDGTLPPPEVLRLGRALADALGAIHAQGVVHRGLAATNIVLRPEGSPCIVGFAYAKFDGRCDTNIQASSILYSARKNEGATALPPHPAPEQIEGRAADARSDLFALGWVLFESLTGTPPYPRDLDIERWGEPADPRKLVPETPKGLAQAIVRCVKKKPLQRFASAAELVAALDAVEQPTTAAAGAGAATSPSWKRRYVPAALAASIAAGIAAVAFLRDDATHAENKRGLADETVASAKAHAADYGASFSSAKALLIGIQDYSGTDWKSLPNAERDAKALAAQLEATKDWERWEVKTLLGKDATKRAIKDALWKLADETQDPESRVFVFYAGHGDKDQYAEGSGYIVPADAQPKSKDGSRESCILYEECFDMLFKRTKAKHVLVALDCCYGGGVSELRGTGDSPVDKLLRRKAHLVFASSRRDEQASDGLQGEHSPFAKAFLDALRDPSRPSVTSSELNARITNVFRDYPNQTPIMGYRGLSGGDGQFVFFTQRPQK